MPDLIGQSLGRYHILEQLGEGGMAIVYKAFDTRLEREVAVKVIRMGRLAPDLADKTRKRFDREAKALARLNHPSIVPVIDFGEYENVPYLVMPYLSGGTLKECIKRGHIPWQKTVKLLAPIARALEYAHRQSIIHRDIKPANVLITETGAPMLSDFGVAKVLSESDETYELTGTGMGVGTPEYMAPEQFQGQSDSRADIYALGVVMYEMITGRKPYIAETPAAVIIKQATEPLPRPNRFSPDLPTSIERILIKALAKTPQGRYQKMGEFARALERLILVGEKENKKREEQQKKNELQKKKRQEREERKREEQKQKKALNEKKQKEKVAQRKQQKAKRAKQKTAQLLQQKQEAKAKPKKPAERLKKKEKSSVPRIPSLRVIFGIVGLGIIYGIVNWIGSFNMTQLFPPSTPTHTAIPASATSETRTSIPATSPTPKNTATPKATSTQEPTAAPELEIGSSWERPADGMRMMYIPAGEFEMGSNDGGSDEKPVHIVYLDAYWMDETEVTNAMYAKCVGAGECDKPGGNYYNDSFYANHPVVNVDWGNAQAYCAWLVLSTGSEQIRLPTEAEWEKAARGGLEGKKYPWGDSPPVCSQNTENGAQFSDCSDRTVEVSSFNSNGYGLYDMSGNLWEWVNDWYSESYYANSPSNNPTGPSSGMYRVLRGGSWNYEDDFLRSANRYRFDPTELRHFGNGFRCARDASPQK